MWYQNVTEVAPPPRSVPEESRLAWSGVKVRGLRWVTGGEGGMKGCEARRGPYGVTYAGGEGASWLYGGWVGGRGVGVGTRAGVGRWRAGVG